MKQVLVLLVLLMASPSRVEAQELVEHAKIAFLGLTFIDTSTEGAINGAREDETARLKLVSSLVQERFMTEGFEILDNAPIAEKLDQIVNPANCYGCEVRLAKKLDADYVLVGVVQKVSNLIISMNLVMRDVSSGKVVRARSVDVRSNTDASWSRGMNYIMKTTFFKE